MSSNSLWMRTDMNEMVVGSKFTHVEPAVLVSKCDMIYVCH